MIIRGGRIHDGNGRIYESDILVKDGQIIKIAKDIKDGEEISDSQRYKCMGNAFTVNVIKYILNSFYDKEVSLNGENN